ncbi:MAG: NEW3 domain-containing protein [Chloroflexota bacterium]
MKTNHKLCWLVLLIVGLVTVLLPGSALAQENRVDLALNLVSGRYPTEVKAGRDNSFYLEVRNTGNKTVTNIKLSSDNPEGWAVTIKPAQIDSLTSGSLQTVNINIKPDEKAAKEDYRIILIADASEIRKVEIIWLRVESASFWLWVGGIVAAVVVAGFVFIFLRFGRK